jgi:hypothetical protein
MIQILALVFERFKPIPVTFRDCKPMVAILVSVFLAFSGSHSLASDSIPEVFEPINLETAPPPNIQPVSMVNAKDTLIAEGQPLIIADTLIEVKEKAVHSPLKATMLSAVLPGLGQIYNGKAWKVPIAYSFFAGVIYAFNFNNKGYQTYRSAWVARIDGNPNTVDDFPNWSADQLQKATNYYRRNLEVTYIVGAAIYVLNILDATVDAHLLDFDVGEDLTMNIRPVINTLGFENFLPGRAYPGVRLTFTF